MGSEHQSPTSRSAPVSSDQASHCLHTSESTLIGRECEIQAACAALARDRPASQRPGEPASGPLVFIRGRAGSGKTALAFDVARRLADCYPDGLLYLDLKGSSPSPLPPADVLARLLHALEPLAELGPDETELQARCRSLLRDRRALLILDNVAGADEVLPLLPPPGSAALLISRRALDLPEAYRLVLGPLPSSDARALLVRLAPHLGAGAEPLAQACSGLPLALHLAGRALAAHTDLAPASYLERLNAAQAQLALVEAVLSASLAQESDERQAQWRTLALLHGFDTPAAAAAWDFEPETAGEILTGFLARGLIEPSPIAPQPPARYQMHETLRDYALAAMDDSQRASDHLRIATHYLEVLRTAARLCAKEDETLLDGLALLDLEWDNVHDGQSWAAQASTRDGLAGQLCSAYADIGGRCLSWRASLKTQVRWLYDGLRAAREWVKPQAEIQHLGRLAALYQCQGKAEQAIAHYRQALGVAAKINDRPAQGEHLGNLGLLYSAQDDSEQAFGYFQQALSVARALGDRENEGNWLGNLGNAYRALGEIEQALRCYRQALAIARERGDRRSEAIWLGNLGNGHMAMGRPQQAIQVYRQALEIAREVGDRQQQENLWGNLGSACSQQGQAEEALLAYESALQIARELADREGEGVWLLNKCLVLDKQGKRQAARSCAEAALDALRQAGSSEAEAAEALLGRWRQDD